MTKYILFLIAIILITGCSCEELTVGTEGTNSTENTNNNDDEDDDDDDDDDDNDDDDEKPDLLVSSIGTPELILDGAAIYNYLVEVTIQNDGKAAAGSFVVKTLYDLVNQGMFMDTVTVDTLEAGETYEFTAVTSIFWPCNDPDCEIRVLIDEVDSVMESNEMNNDTTVLFPEFGLPDFVFLETPVRDNNCSNQQTNCFIKGCISNIGNGSNALYGGSVSVTFYNEDYKDGLQVLLGVIEAGEKEFFEIAIPENVLCVDGCEARFIIDEFDFVMESNEMNNDTTVLFPEYKLPDFVFFGTPTLYPGCKNEDPDCFISGYISNVGTGSTAPYDSVSVTFYHEDYKDGLREFLEIMELGDKVYFEINIPKKMFCLSGCIGRLVIDDEMLIPETDENNTIILDF
ncbi:MAG: CARDB domain-containing protein [Bacteroidota bacterium]